MRRYITILLLALSCYVHAQHRMGVAVAPSMTWQLDSLPHTRSVPGVGGELGLVYQYQYQAFLLQTGIDLSFANMRQAIDSTIIHTDTICRNRVDQMRMMQLSLPLMIGAQAHHFYALAGAKLVLHPHVATYQSASIAVREGGDRYYDDYNQLFMDAHSISNRGKMTLQPDIRACLEIGTRFPIRRYYNPQQIPPIIQIGVFAEYGLLHTTPDTYTSMDNNGHATAKYDIDHIYAPLTDDPAFQLHHLHAGIRVTLLFNILSNHCNCTPF